MKPKAKTKTYPFIAFRPSKDAERRIRKLAKKTGKKISQVVSDCVAKRLPEMETETEQSAA